jgi:hypothetical protein
MIWASLRAGLKLLKNVLTLSQHFRRFGVGVYPSQDAGHLRGLDYDTSLTQCQNHIHLLVAQLLHAIENLSRVKNLTHGIFLLSSILKFRKDLTKSRFVVIILIGRKRNE